MLKFNFLEATNSSKINKSSEQGILTVVNASSSGCGMRLVISNRLREDLRLTDTIQIALSEDGKFLYVGKCISTEATNYRLRNIKKGNPNSKLVLYNSAVVQELSSKMQLDFSDKVSITFKGIRYLQENGEMIAKIWFGGQEHEA